jgi:ABC-type nitrate/sulfonate/bicarbonate transport system substrate-binding protein
MHMHRRTLLVSALAPAAALVSCSRQRETAKRMSLRVSLSRLLTMSPFYTGYEAGYFKDAGFDLELMKELPGMQSLPLLAGGKVDVGFIGLSGGLANAVSSGARLRIVAGREMASPSCPLHGKIFVRSKDFPAGIRDLQALRHRRIAISSASPFGWFCIDQLLERAGMTRADVTIEPMGSSERLAALRAGGVDAFVTTSTDMNPMLKPLGIAPGPSLADVLPNFQYSFIVYGARLLDGDVSTGARFLLAYFRGAQDFLHGKTPAFMDEYAKNNDLDPRQVRAGCRGSFEPDGRIHFGDMQKYLDWAVSHGFLKEPIRAPSLVDTRFLETMQRMA